MFVMFEARHVPAPKSGRIHTKRPPAESEKGEAQ
jgi:hypothetical protein